ncbi:glycosyltransferase involved in cell wall biosynthesis [Ottowia thiooxydans]|uniref:Glycosyltransferase involved in cell wall biosynthesis n=2 Tax=Ottowia thiooxydans TaxID=219182 RepID=A0ABV2QED6_9BURK
MVILDLAKEFRRRGHFPIAFSTKLGQIEKELKQACIPVVSNLDAIGNAPDIIHGQHHLEAMAAMAYFHDTPAVYVCHGWFPWVETPPVFSNIKKYVAVGELTREHISNSCAVKREDISIIPNFVDLEKFEVRKSINKVPVNAAIFGNGIGKNSTLVRSVAEACNLAGMKRLDLFGLRSGNPINNPQEVLPNYDIVFSVGRCAIEAMAVGSAVIICDESGVAEMVRPENMSAMFGRFGSSSLRKERLNADFLCREIRKYDAAGVRQVTDWIREKVDLRHAADRYESVYREAIGRASIETRNNVSGRDPRFVDVGKYIASLAATIKGIEAESHGLNRLVDELQGQRSPANRSTPPNRQLPAMVHRQHAQSGGDRHSGAEGKPGGATHIQ